MITRPIIKDSDLEVILIPDISSNSIKSVDKRAQERLCIDKLPEDNNYSLAVVDNETNRILLNYENISKDKMIKNIRSFHLKGADVRFYASALNVNQKGSLQVYNGVQI